MDDGMLRLYVDEIFEVYDKDRSNTLDARELAGFFNDMFMRMNDPRRFTEPQIMANIDANSDGKASKMEVFNALKRVLSSPNPPQHQYQQPYQQQSYQQPYQQQPYQQQAYQQQPYQGTNYSYGQTQQNNQMNSSHPMLNPFNLINQSYSKQSSQQQPGNPYYK